MKVIIIVAARPGFQGWYSGGKFYANGTSKLDLDPADVEAIRVDQKLGLPIALVEAPTEEQQAKPEPQARTEPPLAPPQASQQKQQVPQPQRR